MNPFHLAIPVNNIKTSTSFYQDILGCTKGRSSSEWVDFNFYGHQLVCHQVEDSKIKKFNHVDGEEIPVPHFGIILNWNEFDQLSKSLIDKNIEFIIKPTIRFAGKTGEQAIMFLKDPSDNAIEFKAFKNKEDIFKTEENKDD
tara:strand:- start:1693 stop:2121 length:429 start_codon:yes stop_codon:yes gene_type:complete